MNGIKTNGSRITPLAVASGAIASFDAQVAATLKILKADINPVQEGSGDPYPPGGGKNLLDPAKRTSYSAGNGQRWYETEGITLKANQSYTMSVSSSESIFVYFMDKATQSALISGRSPQTYTPTEDVDVYLQAYSGVDISDINTFQLERGSSATSYAPYSNIRPISGWDEIKITNESGEIFEAANIVASESEIKAYYDADLILTAGTYVFSTDATDSVTLIGAQYYSGSWHNIFSQPGGTSRKFTLSRAGKCHFRAELRGSGDLSSNTVSLKQLDERTIELPDTVYGGKLDVLKGEGKITRVKAIIDKSILKNYTESYVGFESNFNRMSLRNFLYSDATVSTGYYARSRVPGGVYCKSNVFNVIGLNNSTLISSQFRIYLTLPSGVTDYASWQAYIQDLIDAEIDVEFCYEFSEGSPTDFDTAPISMDAYAGSNKITTDSGNTTACYLKGVTT